MIGWADSDLLDIEKEQNAYRYSTKKKALVDYYHVNGEQQCEPLVNASLQL